MTNDRCRRWKRDVDEKSILSQAIPVQADNANKEN